MIRGTLPPVPEAKTQALDRKDFAAVSGLTVQKPIKKDSRAPLVKTLGRLLFDIGSSVTKRTATTNTDSPIDDEYDDVVLAAVPRFQRRHFSGNRRRSSPPVFDTARARSRAPLLNA